MVEVLLTYGKKVINQKLTVTFFRSFKKAAFSEFLSAEKD